MSSFAAPSGRLKRNVSGKTIGSNNIKVTGGQVRALAVTRKARHALAHVQETLFGEMRSLGVLGAVGQKAYTRI